MKTLHINSAASTNSKQVQKNRGTVYSLDCFNAGGAAAYVKLYNKATAPVVGTNTPVMVLAVPAAGNARLKLDYPAMFNLGIGIAITGAAADSDTTAVAANQVKATLVYGG